MKAVAVANTDNRKITFIGMGYRYLSVCLNFGTAERDRIRRISMDWNSEFSIESHNVLEVRNLKICDH